MQDRLLEREQVSQPLDHGHATLANPLAWEAMRQHCLLRLVEYQAQFDRQDLSRIVQPVDQAVQLNFSLDRFDSKSAATTQKKSRWKGVVVSALFHVAVIIALATVTLDSPIKDGLLSLVSGSTSSEDLDSFELTSPMEITETLDVIPETNVPVSQPTLTEVLPGFSESIMSAVSQSNVPVQTVSSSSKAMAVKSQPNKQAVSFYGAESTGNSFCFVLDFSGSMRGEAWEAARFELLKSINSLKPSQRFHIILYNEEVYPLPSVGESSAAKKPLAAVPENIAHAQRWLESMQITVGGRGTTPALELALALECDCIYFLGDGDMSSSSANWLLNALKKKNRQQDILDGEVVLVPIHTIAYHNEGGIEIMKRIANENRGQFSFVPKPKSKTSRK